ncbi:MAG: peptidase M16-like protein [Elusimicrobia bacterium]|nr:MAG: peptidase M16-like protein [Elusimicrobiota bacterium]KAF0155493.1 MAG: peptidase M16-like protein [Elusimicrobiota bacterium]
MMTAAAYAADHPVLSRFGALDFKPGKPERYVLDNGLTVYILRDNTLPIVHISAFIRAGNAHDLPGKAGIAQMTSYLVKDGGSARYKADEIDRELEYLGASISGDAFSEETRLEMTALKKDLGKILDIYSDVVMNPVFEEEKVKTAREAELEVIRRRNDKPDESAVREAKRMFYGPAHPYGVRTELDTVGSITRADLLAFHGAFYRPNNAILAVSGDFQSDEAMLKMLREKFGGWKKAEVGAPAIPPAPELAGRRVYLIDKKVTQAFLVVMQKGTDYLTPDNYPLAVMTDIVGGGFQSRLFREVRTNRGLAYSVYSANARRKSGGFLFSSCGTKPETYSQALSEILKQLELAGAAPPATDEISRSKGSIVNPFVFKFSTPHKLVSERALEEFYGFKPGHLDGFVADVSAVSAGSAMKAGKKYFDPSRAVIFVIGDKSKFDRPLSDFGPVTELKED